MTDIERALVIGATGNIGRIAVDLLHRRGVHVRALAREARRLPAGVEAVSADVRNPGAWRTAADDVDAVLLIWPFMEAAGIEHVAPVLGRPGRRIAYVSAMHVRDDRTPAQNGVWGQVEAAVRATGADWTLLRASGFATNTLQWAAAIRAGEPVRIPYVSAARSLIHERDLAESAVAALTSPAHGRRSYVLSGPSAVTQAEQVRLLGGVAEEISPEEARAGMDPGFADAALPYWASLVDNPEPVAGGVRDLTGHEARSFGQWAADHAVDFRP
ncbi:SDR family oxidoreductase [Dactylosporangium sp. CS-047395]|uniref:SDR family oxidoreductase n=1 Tax=Dactylosporangium sp. CS-047395 TaxID=3239936 RepID=UPI003D8B70B3